MAKKSQRVDSNEKTTTKKLGGITGKGFMPGQSGNPAGRPKKTLLTEVCEEMLAEKLEDPKMRKQLKDALWAKLLSGRVVGSMTLDTLWDRTEGKVAQPLKVDGEVKISLADAIKEARERAANA